MFFGGYRRFSAATWPLHRAVVRDDENLDRSTIRHWLQGSPTGISLQDSPTRRLQAGTRLRFLSLETYDYDFVD